MASCSEKAREVRIERFEDLECWKEARELIKAIYSFTRGAEISRDFRLTGQIAGAAISIMNNISEGFDSGSNKEFMRFLSYSRRSCSEVQRLVCTWLQTRNILKRNSFWKHISTVKRCEKLSTD